jgi:hypothetical protein
MAVCMMTPSRRSGGTDEIDGGGSELTHEERSQAAADAVRLVAATLRSHSMKQTRE